MDPSLVGQLRDQALRRGLSSESLVIGTYRDTDLTRTHPFTPVLADLRREVNVERLALHGLDDAAVVALVTAAAGHPLTANGLALARAIHAETEGSPFFISEILRNLVESGVVFQEGGHSETDRVAGHASSSKSSVSTTSTTRSTGRGPRTW